MNIIEYINSSEQQRNSWIDTLSIEIGLTYFGGKGGKLGKDVMRAIINEQANTYIKTGEKRNVFVDGFCGGGKMALSVPYGWFDKVIMNDLDYGTYNFFKCCKDKEYELIEAIKGLYDVFIGGINKDVKINYQLYETLKMTRLADEDVSWENDLDMYKLGEDRQNAAMKNGFQCDTDVYSAAKTALITDLSFMHTNDKSDYTSYRYGNVDKQIEKEALYRSRDKILGRITEINKTMHRKNIIVTRGDYATLVDFNEQEKDFLKKNNYERKELEDLIDKRKVLYYLDSPYHPLTLNNMEEAPYDCPFSRENCLDMTTKLINHMKNDEGFSFIKSDYDPAEFKNRSKQAIHKNQLIISSWKNEWTQAGINQSISNMPWEDFKILEKEGCKKCFIGEYSKSGSNTSSGREYIWVYPNYKK